MVHTMCIRYCGQLMSRNILNSYCKTIGSPKKAAIVRLWVQHASMVTIKDLENPTEEQQELIKWIELAESSGLQVPSTMSLNNFKIFSEKTSISGKKELLRLLYLYENHKKTEHNINKYHKELTKIGKQNVRLPNEKTHIKYGVWQNTVHMKYLDIGVKTYFNASILQNYLLAPNIVVDCNFDSLMTNLESKILYQQIERALVSNREAEFPSNLHLCNVDKTSNFYEYLERILKSDDNLPLYIHEESYLDIFPADKVVYLCPDARYEMEQYDPDTVYIIGGLVERTNYKQTTLAKAKKENISMQRLPLCRHIKMRGSRTLDVDCVFQILNSLHISNDWNEALQHVPEKFVVSPNPAAPVWTIRHFRK